MRITELFTAKSIELDSAASNRDEILSRLVELQATHGNITDTEAYKKALYAREDEASTYVDNGITVPHAKTNVVTRPSLAALRLSTPVQYNAEDDGTTDLLFAIAAPENGSLHVDMLARMMQMLMNEDFVEKLKAARTPAEFLALIDAQEEAQFGEESFTQQAIPQSGYRILAVTACPNGIAHTYMAAEALAKAGDKLGLPTKVETNGSDGAKNVLTRAEIAACDGIIVAADKNVETARFDGKPVLFARVDDGIHKPEELLKKVAHGEVPVYHAKGGAAAAEEETSGDSFGRKVYKDLMNGVSHMLPFVVGHLSRPLIGRWVDSHRPLIGKLDQSSILLVVYVAFSEAVVQGIWHQVGWYDLASIVLLSCVLLALVLAWNVWISRRLGFNKADEITIVFCGSKKSLANGVPMANVMFPAASVGVMVLPLMIFHQIQLMVCAVLARRYREQQD